MFDILSSTEVGFRSSFKRPSRLTPLEMLSKVCSTCVGTAHMYGLRDLCEHGKAGVVCRPCSEAIWLAAEKDRNHRLATVSKIRSITGDTRCTVGELRSANLDQAVTSVLRAYARTGSISALAYDLGWSSTTLHALLK